jgi:hypothetical protein
MPQRTGIQEEKKEEWEGEQKAKSPQLTPSALQILRMVF